MKYLVTNLTKNIGLILRSCHKVTPLYFSPLSPFTYPKVLWVGRKIWLFYRLWSREGLCGLQMCQMWVGNLWSHCPLVEFFVSPNCPSAWLLTFVLLQWCLSEAASCPTKRKRSTKIKIYINSSRHHCRNILL